MVMQQKKAYRNRITVNIYTKRKSNKIRKVNTRLKRRILKNLKLLIALINNAKAKGIAIYPRTTVICPPPITIKKPDYSFYNSKI